MITYEEALEIVLANAPSPVPKTVPLHQANGRILLQDVVSDHDMPPFNKSAMDGYACRAADLPGPLHCLETIAAGAIPSNVINVGRCARIMTGAIVPEGADCVFMVEQSEILEDNSVRFTGEGVPGNICFKGEDVKTGDTVLSSGTLIHPAHIAVLAGAGCTEPIVAAAPRVGIIATGSELVQPDQPVNGAAIRETNGHQLVAQVAECGAVPTYYGIVEDERVKIADAIHKATDENDVVLICGGSSAGDFDYVPELLQQAGCSIHFDSMATQPGKPLTFASGNGETCFGMPGNPVSTFMVMETIVKPFLYHAMGHNYRLPVEKIKMGRNIRRRKAARKSFVPASLNPNGTVMPLEYHGSAHIHALAHADAWIIFPIGETELKQDEPADVWRLI